MAKQALSVDLESVFNALLWVPGFRSLPEAELTEVKNIVALLPGAVGHRLSDKVTVATFFEVEANFLKAILDSSFDLYYPDRGFTRSEIELLEMEARELSELANENLHKATRVDVELLLSEHFPFTRRIRRLVSRRRLTFHHVLHNQPAIFLPKLVMD